MQNFAGKTSPEQNAIIPERLVEQGQALSRPELNIKSQKGCQGSTLDVRAQKMQNFARKTSRGKRNNSPTVG